MKTNATFPIQLKTLLKRFLGNPLALGIAVVILLGAIYLVIDHFVSSSNDLTIDLETQAQVEEEDTILVHVAGCVLNPGLYELADGSRINDAIEAAGGFSEDANKTSLNLARVLVDGEQIIVADKNVASTTAGTGTSSYGSKININSCTQSELETLNGIGEATAKRIILYRNENGYFRTIEDLMNVSGIGEKKFEAIKNDICV